MREHERVPVEGTVTWLTTMLSSRSRSTVERDAPVTVAPDDDVARYRLRDRIDREVERVVRDVVVGLALRLRASRRAASVRIVPLSFSPGPGDDPTGTCSWAAHSTGWDHPEDHNQYATSTA